MQNLGTLLIFVATLLVLYVIHEGYVAYKALKENRANELPASSNRFKAMSKNNA